MTQCLPGFIPKCSYVFSLAKREVSEAAVFRVVNLLPDRFKVARARSSALKRIGDERQNKYCTVHSTRRATRMLAPGNSNNGDRTFFNLLLHRFSLLLSSRDITSAISALASCCRTSENRVEFSLTDSDILDPCLRLQDRKTLTENWREIVEEEEEEKEAEVEEKGERGGRR